MLAGSQRVAYEEISNSPSHNARSYLARNPGLRKLANRDAKDITFRIPVPSIDIRAIRKSGSPRPTQSWFDRLTMIAPVFMGESHPEPVEACAELAEADDARKGCQATL